MSRARGFFHRLFLGGRANGLGIALILCVITIQRGIAVEAPVCPAELRFGVYEFNIFNTGGKGIDLDVIAAMRKRTGCAITLVDEPRARIWVDLESGALDMTGSALVTSTRSRFAWFAPYAALKNYAITLAPTARIGSAQDLLADDGLLIGAVLSYRHGGVIDAMLDQLRQAHSPRLREVLDQEALFDLLMTDRSFVIFAQPNAYPGFLQKRGLTGATIVDIAPGERPIPCGLALSKARFSAEEAAKWQDIIDSMHRDGTLTEIVARYARPADVSKLMDF